MDPSKKGCIKIDSKQVQKLYLNAPLTDLYTKFCTESNFRISYTTFTRLRPAHCVPPKISARDTCACFLHENFKLFVQALHNNKIIVESSPNKIVMNLICQQRLEKCYARKCSVCARKQISLNFDHKINEELSFYKWVTKKEQRISAKTNKNIVVQITKKEKVKCQMIAVKNLFNSELNLYLEHEYKIYHQQLVIKRLKENLQTHECLILMDFSENYLCKCATEVQSVHFGASRQQISLHTGMFYTFNFFQGFSTLSESLRHDAAAVIAHLKVVLNFYLTRFSNVTTIHFLSDGPTTQYKNRSMFYLITQYLPKCYTQINTITYNFSVAGHGKSPADGIGGTLKRIADNEVKYGKDIPNFESLTSILKRQIQNIYIATVTLQQINLIDNEIPAQIKSFIGTRQIQQYVWISQKPLEVNFNLLSCFQCLYDSNCNHFLKGKLKYDSNELEESQKRSENKLTFNRKRKPKK